MNSNLKVLGYGVLYFFHSKICAKQSQVITFGEIQLLLINGNQSKLFQAHQAIGNLIIQSEASTAAHSAPRLTKKSALPCNPMENGCVKKERAQLKVLQLTTDMLSGH